MPPFTSGWVPSPFDPRDMPFRAPVVGGPLARKVRLDRPTLPAPYSPAWSQNRLGSCGPHSAAKDIVFAGLRQQGLASVPMPSRLFIYWCARKLMGTLNQDSGVTNRDLLKALNQFGWCDEALWSYSDDAVKYRQEPPAPCFTQAATRTIKEYLSVPQDLAQMKACLAGPSGDGSDGDPFIFGFTVYPGLTAQTTARSGIVPMPRAGEAPLGGHDVLVIGYDDDAACFTFVNSWGPEWGVEGCGTIPYQYASNPRLAGDFWTVRHAALAPVPTPTPLPIPGRRTTVVVDWDAMTFNGIKVG